MSSWKSVLRCIGFPFSGQAPKAAEAPIAAQVPTINMKLLVDKEKNRVAFAEVDGDFVDVLCSFLTLPVGTVLRLLSKQSPQLELGSMHNLYRSVNNLEGKYFVDDISKKMLLKTRNSSADICRNLKVNIDDTEPMKYYMCPNFSYEHVPEGILSTFSNVQCGCGGKLVKEISLTPPSAIVDQENGTFLKPGGSFIITDDLQVIPLSSESALGVLNNRGARAEALEVKTIAVTKEEVYLLLKHILLSKTSLTETFLLEQREVSSKPKSEEINEFYSAKKEKITDTQKINLNVIVKESNDKIICAEAGDDFVSFMMSMLTFPLGSVVKLLDGNPAPGSISTLYESVENLSVVKYMKSEHHRDLLLSPKLALQYSCNHQLLDNGEPTTPSYFYNNRTAYGSPPPTLSSTPLYKYSYPDEYSRNLNLFKVKGFARQPTTFMLRDNLVVTPFSSTSTITMLNQLKLSMDDVKRRVLSIGRLEALQLLGASMTSKRALTSVLRTIARKNIK